MSKIKLLLVEDEAITYMLYQMQFNKLGYEVSKQAISGEEAIQMAGEEKPDVVLMDIGLCGKMDGIQAAGIIHSRYGIPIIFVTGYADEVTRSRADKEVGHCGYFVKPIDPGALITTIDSALGKSNVCEIRVSPQSE